MKKRILAAIVATLLCLTALLSSCIRKDGETLDLKFSDIMAPSADEEEKVISGYSKLNVIGEYLYGNETFMLTEQDALDDQGNTTGNYDLKVYNILTDTCIWEGTTVYEYDYYNNITNEVNYYFHIIDDKYFSVLTETFDEYRGTSTDYSDYFGISIYENADYSISVYDKTGAELQCEDNIYVYNFDDDYEERMSDYVYDDNDSGLYYVGDKLYKTDEDGNHTLVKEFGIDYKPDLDYLFEIGDYYYYYEYHYYSDAPSLQIYDEDLDPVMEYSFPSYINSTSSDLLTFSPLGTDRILIQYAETLHQDAEDYDFREGTTGKFDLVTLVLNLADNTTTEIDVNYKINSITPTAVDEGEDPVYSNVVANIAFITYIDENKHLDLSPTNYEIVGLSDDGSICAFITIDGCIAELPVPYGDGLYMAQSAVDSNMYYIYNAAGEIISRRNPYYEDSFGDYIYTKNAIYKLDGTKVYDLDKKEVYTMSGSSAILYLENDDATTYSLFCDGTVTEIGICGGDNATIDGFDYYYDYYYVYDNDAETYTYYNTKGNVIGIFEEYLSHAYSTEDVVILYSAEWDDLGVNMEYNYYRFDIK